MRVYLPGTLATLRAALTDQAVTVLGGTAFAVTAPLRAEYPDWSKEDLEYLAMQDASRASLRLLAAAGDEERGLRVVVAADVPDAEVTARPEADRAVVEIPGSVPWSAVASAHVDLPEAEQAVREATGVIDTVDLELDEMGDAAFVLGSAEDFGLAWYAPDELVHLLADLDAGGTGSTA